jgi:asparagine synthase (glutamine-hydrolysing)
VSSLLAVLAGQNARPASSNFALRATVRSVLADANARVATWASDDERVSLAVAREEWECSPWLAGDAVVASRGPVSVVADAALYARRDLAATLIAGGQHVSPDDSAAALIAAAYLARGAAALLELNGDFAFILWDAQQQILLLGRDFAATRPLFYGVLGGRLLVSSTLSGVLALSGDARPAFDRLGLAEAASGLAEGSGRTCYVGVRSVQPGRVMGVSPSLEVKEVARWRAPEFETGSATSFTDAAHELRELIGLAVADRMAPDMTTVWMSGGYDSSSVFASARAALSSGPAGRVESISVSYPEGDQGREDEIIERILAHHNVTGRWIDSAELPLLGDVSRNARRRDEPFAAMYDGFFRRASQGSRDAGARVALSGHGGDVLFDSSMVYFADLLSGMHLRTLRDEWKASREALWRPSQLLEEMLAPLVPEQLAKRTAAMLGRQKERFHEPAPWVRTEVATEIADTGWMPLGRHRGESRTSAVARWSLEYPFFTKSQEAAAAAARSAGVEYRMPLLDPRVIALAATRPRWEKRSGVRSKSLLRAAMKGMLPEEVLWPRLYKTGLTKDYLMRSVQEEFPKHAAALCHESALADLGVIDPSGLTRAVAESATDTRGWMAGHLYFTFQAEYWLRSRLSVADHLTPFDDVRGAHVPSRETLIA